MKTRNTLLTRLARAASATILLAAVVGSFGCRGMITGDWKMVEVAPNKEVFNISQASFQRDGNYSATSTIEGKTIREVGTYEYNGFKLTLRPQAGGQRKYNATLRMNRLEIADGDRRVVLKKS